METSTIAIWCVLLILALTVFGKWIAFIFVSPLIIFSSRRKRSAQQPDNQQITPPQSNSGVKPKRKPLIKRIFGKFRYYYFGYKRYMDFQVGLIPSHTVRNFIYRRIFGVGIGRGTIVYWGAEIRAHNRLKIGRNSIIGDHAILDARNGIEIGDNVNFSSGVHIWTEQHDHRDPDFACNSDGNFKVTIRNRAWVGPGVTILHSVDIGEGAVIAAGAVVTKSVEPFAIMAGIPARKIGERNRNLRYELDSPPSPFY